MVEKFLFREPVTREMHLKRIREDIAEGRVVQFIIGLTADGSEIGSQYFHHIDAAEKSGEFGIFIGEESALGCGYGKDVLELCLPYAYDVIGLNCIYLRVLAENTAALKTYEKAGFVHKPEKDLELDIDGEKRKVLYMEHVRA